MTVTPEQRAQDLTLLRERWRRQGQYEGRTIGDQLQIAAERYPDRGFIFASPSGDVTLSFPEVLEQSKRVASGLQRLGVRQGDRVAIQVPNRPEMVFACYGALLAGAVIVPITHIYGPAEMAFIIRQSGAKVIVIPDAWRKIDYRERIERLEDVPGLETVVMIGAESAGSLVSWGDLTASSQYAAGNAQPDDVCVILYTSGTTSAPKGVQHTHHTLLAEMGMQAEMLGMKLGGGSKLSPWPAGHVAGLAGVLVGICTGITSVLMEYWDVDEAVRLISSYGCTTTSGTPLHINAILDVASQRRVDISSLRFVQVGGTNVPRQLVARAESAGLSLARAYGSTEHPTVTWSPPNDGLEKRAATDGRAWLGNELRVVDDLGADVPHGEDGEIVTRGPEQFVGYWDSSLDQDSFLPGGWFLTGDIGHFDPDDYLVVTDRRKDIIIRGGENIASKEVENVLASHPDVVEVAVVAAPDERYGERVAAFVTLADSCSDLTLEDVRSHFGQAGVAKQKTPELIIVVQSLPKTPSGKIQKAVLRDRLRAQANGGSDGG